MYEPTADDLNWARTTLALLLEGGTLVFPVSATIYARTKVVFNRVGYAVTEAI